MARPRSSLKSKSKPVESVRGKQAGPARKPPVRAAASKPATKPVNKSAAKNPAAKPAKTQRWVYAFGGGKAEGKPGMRNLLGGKGAGLAEMANLGLPVPPGFTIPTEVCTYYYANGNSYPAALEKQVATALAEVGRITGKTFGDKVNPLLVSVRSGARASMPGMMDTVLNLGLNDETVEALAQKSGDRRFAYDSYRRFITMYSDVVLGIGHEHFEEILDDHKDRNGYTLDTDLTAKDWEHLVGRYKKRLQEEHGEPFPQDPFKQLWGAISAVFGSWMNQRAVTYRRLHNIPESWGTAVNVQAMVFGNMGETSATGVAFTRNPSTGEKQLYGEFLINAQGEDVVAGIRTPQEITEAARKESGSDKPSMEAAMPGAFKELTRIYRVLEKHYRDMQDLEFTVEQDKLWMLQTRSGKRTAKAALRIAVELANEGLISRKEAVTRVDPAALDQLLHPTIDPAAERKVIAAGLPASPGAATGEIVFSADDAEDMKAQGKKVILVRIETSPEDIHGMHAAEGILTTRGGMTSHAAVVARGMGKPCVSGAGTLRVDYGAGTMTVAGQTFRRGDFITVDGSTGQVLAGRVAMVEPALSGEFGTLMGWADAVRKLGVRANADTPNDARVAVKFGAEGIGLCRTEHMFFEEDRIRAVREMILADDEKQRRAALAKLLPMQRADFVELFEIMAGKPVTIRLLDPPLHEFLPHGEDEIAEVAKAMGMDTKRLKERAAELHEFNPMLGFRGCRIAIAYPEIAEMQARAIFEAAVEVGRKTGAPPIPEVMVPLVAAKSEFDLIR
ncbi:MAG TPA: pyruvate, phosphate dikinase, partial [Methyloceanibacter sp.]|nr:pyruvate, phosphate dikinase [Methyloceanibacter sp.]